MTETKSVAESIAAARDSLTEENWHKGNYFFAKGDTVCMCAHGAMQAQVNPVVAKALSQKDCAAQKATAAVRRASSAAALSEAAEAGGRSFSDRPDWVKTNNLDSHYILGMAGLTVAFNDSAKTTLADVKQKFNEAEKIAVELGLGPKVRTIAELLPGPDVAPNLNAGKTANPANEATSADYRRRLLGWAELLETDMVAKHWDYETYKKGNMGKVTLSAKEDVLSCGTVACAAGWVHVLPEAASAGFMPNFYRMVNGYEQGCETSSPEVAANWFGVTTEDLYAIYMASPVEGMPALRMGGENASTPKDVAKAIRWLADERHPLPKPAKPIKKGTKRYWAKFFRDGANFLETHNHGRIRLYRPDDNSYCALGSCAAVLLPEGTEPSEWSLGEILGDVFKTDWYEGQGMFTDLVKRLEDALESKYGIKTASNNYARNVSSFNDDYRHSKGMTVEFMRGLAFMLDHGGQLPKNLRKYAVEEE